MQKLTDYIPSDSCTSLTDLFLQRVAKSSAEKCYQYFDRTTSSWQTLTWQEIYTKVCQWQHGLQLENLNMGDRVAIMLNNRVEWIAFEQAALSLGLIVVPLYANDRPESIGYILEKTEAKILLCPGPTYWDQLNTTIDTIQHLQRIITLDFCKTSPDNEILVCAKNWLPEISNSRTLNVQSFHNTATIVFTSGTTGPPKGVMLSHRNILDNCYSGLQCMDIYPYDTFLSFLPLSHMLERTVGYYLPMMTGSMVTFARSIPELAEDLTIIKPSILVAVPRIFERVHGSIMAKLSSKPKFIAKLLELTADIGWQSYCYSQGRGNWKIKFLLHSLLDTLFAKKIRKKLGGNLRIIITGGAPLSSDIAKFFIGLGLPLFQGYGLTETSPIISVNRLHDNRPQGVGKVLPNVEVKIGENSELLVRGSLVMQGYWKNKKATQQTIDQDGWLYTGDKAVIEDGHIKITGRIKEIIVLSNGEKVAPADIEMAINLYPLFETSLVIGEGRPFLTLLAVLNEQAWEEFAEQEGVSKDTASLDLPEVRDKILKKIEDILSSFPGFVFIKDITLTLTPWSVEEGQLTPTLKLKREVIKEQMEKQIESMYSLNS